MKFVKSIGTSFRQGTMKFHQTYFSCCLFVSLFIPAIASNCCQYMGRCPKSTSLTLAGKSLGALPVGGFCKPPFVKTGKRSHLTCLCITQDNIQDIKQNAFKCLEEMHYLALCDCNITYIREGAFKSLHQLQRLSLNGESV